MVNITLEWMIQFLFHPLLTNCLMVGKIIKEVLNTERKRFLWMCVRESRLLVLVHTYIVSFVHFLYMICPCVGLTPCTCIYSLGHCPNGSKGSFHPFTSLSLILTPPSRNSIHKAVEITRGSKKNKYQLNSRFQCMKT